MNGTHDDLAVATLALRLDLCMAAAVFEESVDIGDKRASMLLTLRAIGQFLNAIGLSDRAIAPFHSLVGALEDAERGKSHPLIEPVPIGKKGPLHLQELAIRGIAAAIMELYMRAGEMEKRAAELTATGLRRAGIPIKGDTRQAPDWTIVRRWREHAMTGTPADWDTARYRKILSGVERAGIDARQAADRLLLNLKSFPYRPIEKPEDPEI
jgi:hypothetical protein